MKRVIAIFIFLFLLGCTAPDQKIFHYQLQDAEFEKLEELDVSFLIIDLDDSEFTKQEITMLKAHEKKILCYLSIGEAEDYRDYWVEDWKVGNPPFIDYENPDWEGNYRVKYWDLEWQDIILEKVEKIVETGCSGVYLDTIDSYFYYEELGDEKAADEMILFISKISKKAKGVDTSFLIVPQNAEKLYKFENYHGLIDGIGKEDTWFYDDEINEVSDTMKYLNHIYEDGKFVLSVDYPTEIENVCDFYKECSNQGFYCTVSNRDLNLDKPVECA